MLYDILTGKALFGEYIFLLLVFAGAWMTGRSVANEWKKPLVLVAYAFLLALGARFLHFALYEAQFVSLQRYLVDLLPIAIFTWLGYQMTRTNQMTRQYNWLYEKASPLTWRAKTQDTTKEVI
jgi:hypothetical protein